MINVHITWLLWERGVKVMSILKALVPPRKKEQPLRIVGVADLDPDAPGIITPKDKSFCDHDFADLFRIPDMDMVVDATGHPEVSQQLQEQAPKKLTVLNIERPDCPRWMIYGIFSD